MLKRIIELADIMCDLQNYNGVMIILSALSSSPVSRLHRTFQTLDKATIAKYAKLRFLMSHESNFKNYRKVLKDLPPETPCIPYVGIFLSDLRFIMDSSETLVPSDSFGLSELSINWAKLSKAYEIVANLGLLQSRAIYPSIQPSSELLNWLTECKHADFEACHQMSRRIEPPDYEILVEDLMLNEKSLKSRLQELETLLAERNAQSISDSVSP